MKITTCLLLALACSFSAFAQDDLPRGEEIVLSTDELKSLTRKMAELRARRYALYQQRYVQWQQYYANLALLQNKEIDREIVVTTDGSRTDTTFVINQGTDSTDELAELRRRLDRQEELLLEIRDVNDARLAKAAPVRRDTVIQRIMTTEDPNRLTREDLRRLTEEMEDMNDEVNRLQSRLALEENRRRRAEDRMQDALRDRNYGRYERDTEFRPNVFVDPNRSAPTVVRDTVFVDRDREVIRRDTLVEVREAEPTIIRDTVVQDRVVRDEVVRVETVELAAKEPIGFPTVFFDNNSSALNTNHRNILATMVDDMRSKGGYTVRLTGYASQRGSADYNMKLSANRAEAVKQGLVALGVPESRIRLVAGGIDYQATTPAAGRRVEVVAIPQ